MGFWKIFLGFDPNRMRSFPGQQAGEEVEYMGVFHWMTIVPLITQMLLASVILLTLNLTGVLEGLSPEARFAINSSAAAMIVHVFCFRLYNFFLKVMLMTNMRLIEIRHSVFLKREREVIPLSNIQDIRYQQNGIMARIFGYGNLIVLGSSSDVKYEFLYVPKVNKVHHILGELHQAAIHRRPRSIKSKTDDTHARAVTAPAPAH